MANTQTGKSMPQSVKRETKRADRRARIRGTALKLFSSVGYDRTSLQDIADTLGLTHPALYYYYKSKSDLLFDAIKMSMETMYSDMEASIEGFEGSADAKLRALIERQVKTQFTTKDSIRLIDSALYGAMNRSGVFTDEQAKILVELQKKTVALYKNILAEGERNDVFRLEDKTVATFAILGAVSNVPYWFRPKGKLSEVAAARKLADYLLKSVR